MPKQFDLFSRCFKPKDTSDSSESSNESQSSRRDFTRREYERRQQEAFSSHHFEMSDYSPDKLLPSKRMMKLENGMPASAKDIEAIEDLRVGANPLESYDSEGNQKALKDLEMKLKNPDHQLSDGVYYSRGKELIDENKNLTDSAKNIVGDLIERGCLFDADEPIATQVKLRNGTEVHYKVVDDIMSKLEEINQTNHDAVLELRRLCEDPNQALKSDTAKILQSKGLINEQLQPLDSVKNIVSCSFDEQSRQLRSPAIRMYELLIMLGKTTQDDKEKMILNRMYPHQYRFEPLKPSAHAPDKLLPSEQEVRLENGTYASAMDIHRIDYFRDNCCFDQYDMYEDRKKACSDLLKKCKDATYQLSNESRQMLVDQGLINEKGEPCDSVKNIMLYLFEQGRSKMMYSTNTVEQVKLRNGTEVHYKLAERVKSRLKEINKQNPQAVSELYEFCQDPNNTLKGDTTEVLKSKGLIDGRTGQPRDSVKNIVLCSFDEESRQLRSPVMPLDELLYERLLPIYKTKVNKEDLEKFRDNLLVLKRAEKMVGKVNGFASDGNPHFKELVRQLVINVRKDCYKKIEEQLRYEASKRSATDTEAQYDLSVLRKIYPYNR